jgi:hypothetical protein
LSPLLHEKYRSRANALNSTNGSSRAKYRATASGLNPLEILHVRLGHTSEDLIQWIVKSGVCDGLGYTYDQIKHLQLPLCDVCMKGRMKAFPIRPSMTASTYGIFEYLTLNIIQLIVAADTSTPHCLSTNVLLRHLLTIVTAFKKLLRDYHPQRLPRCLEMRILHTDFDFLVLDMHFNDVLVEKTFVCALVRLTNINRILLSATSVALRNGIRTVLAYNNVPIRYWCYAMDYFCYIFNNLPRINEISSESNLTSVIPGVIVYDYCVKRSVQP